MKNFIKVLFIAFISQTMYSCMDTFEEEFMANSPVYMGYEELRDAVVLSSARELKNTGKIYFKDNFIFINEQLKGVHIIDNSDPSNPVNKGFIEIPGNVDIAIKNTTLYADSYVDMVAIDVSNLDNIHEVSRVTDVFPYTLPPYDKEYRVAEIDQEKGVVIDWEVKKVKQELEQHYYPVYKEYLAMNTADLITGSPSGGGSGPSFGIGGSMARFGLYEDYLYTVNENTLYIFNVVDPENPKDIGSQYVGWAIETMFIYDGHMFFGSQNGMLIYSLAVATVPKQIGMFWHVTSCDPVVVQDGYAYITLRGGNLCGSNVNRLDVVELSNNYIDNTLVASYPMHGPYGLGIDGEVLFVCDGDKGLKIYNISDKLNIDKHLIKAYPSINAYDVIPVNGNLFLIGEDGFYQYDYSDIQNITQLSSIPVAKSGP